MAVSNGNYALTYVENGFEIRFSIGDTTITVDDLLLFMYKKLKG